MGEGKGNGDRWGKGDEKRMRTGGGKGDEKENEDRWGKRG